MKDFAVIWTTDAGYFPGTNASLNALEFYGNDVDVYILTWTDFLTDEYKGQWDNVHFNPMDTTKQRKVNSWYFRFVDIIYALDELFSKYKAVLFWGADVCLTSNIMDYFDICASTSKVILGTNEHGSHDLEKLSKAWPYNHTWDVPYADVPFFVPSGNTDCLKQLVEYQGKGHNKLSRMDGLNYAIRDCNTKVISVPGELWVQNVPYKFLLTERNKKIFLHESSTQLCSFHRKYWLSNICRTYLPGSDDRTKYVSKSNKMLFNRMYNFFNRECRVKWTDWLEVWDGQ